MEVVVEDKVAPTFIRPWNVTTNCTERRWLDTLANAFATNKTGSVATLRLRVNADGSIVNFPGFTGHAELYNYIQSTILFNAGQNATPTSPNQNVFTRLSGTDCGPIDLDVEVRRPGWHCDAGS